MSPTQAADPRPLAGEPLALDLLNTQWLASGTPVDLLASEPGAWSMTRLTNDMAEDPATAEEVSKPMASWVEFIADIVRRAQADGDFRPDLEPHDVAVVLVGSFDGLKALTDVLNPGAPTSEIFNRRAQVLLAMVEHGMLTSTGKGGGRGREKRKRAEPRGRRSTRASAST